ncbi:hypothetical protein XENOCAPTIV_004084 [Xenoophorus captivus]|uniref:Uncharacterized protein n=1 Tax=Xenoophorus captivus TaxID=1517983 RepID=A0ABV0SFI6_9TELE
MQNDSGALRSSSGAHIIVFPALGSITSTMMRSAAGQPFLLQSIERSGLFLLKKIRITSTPMFLNSSRTVHPFILPFFYFGVQLPSYFYGNIINFSEIQPTLAVVFFCFYSENHL